MSSTSMKSPFKFLDSYGVEDQHIFFGRDQEVEEVYDKVFQSKLLLVYGASGTGKSSIINCGLANKFDESDWFPIRVRRGGNMRRSMFNQIEKEAIQKVSLTDEEKLTNKGLERVINSVYLDHFKPIYLIFDQFEELFIFGFKDEWKDFISAIHFLMETNLDIHFIFVIRGEYLEYLSEFEELIPDFFDNRMRVEKMTRKKAHESILGPAKEFDIQVDDGFEENLLKKLSPDKSHIELTFLQVFLDKIYRNATAGAITNENIRFTNDQIEELGQLGDVLAEFVDEQLFQMDDPKAALTVLKSFVSLQGTKVQNSIEEVIGYCSGLGQPISRSDVEAIIQSFVNKRILKDHDDNGKYELRHDSLAQKIFEKITNQEKELLDVKQFLNYSLNEYEKRGTLLNDEDISYISFYERNLEIGTDLRAFIELSKKKSKKRLRNRKTRLVITIIILILLVTSAAGFFYSVMQKTRAEELALIAEMEKTEAENQKLIAEQQSAIALQNEQNATEQAQIAQNQKQLADHAKLEADKQRNLAIEQKIIADKERIEAEQARFAAEESELRALELKKIAEEQKSIALKLRSLAIAQGIANKSSFVADPELKTLLSLQALNFNKANNGNAYEPDIYTALYNARKAYFDNENLLYSHSNTISQARVRPEGYYFIATDGQLGIVNKNSTNNLLRSNEVFETFEFIDDHRIAIGSQDGTFLIFDLSTKSILINQKIHNEDITKIISHDGNIITSSLDGLIKRLDQNGVIVKSYTVGEKVNDIVQGKNEIWAITDKTLYRLKDDQITPYRISDYQNFTKITFNEKLSALLIGTATGDIIIWDTSSNEVIRILSGHATSITDLEISHDTKFLASSSLDRTVRVWPLNESFNQPIVIGDHDNWVSDIAFDKGKIISVTYDGEMKIFELSMDSLADGLCLQVQRNLTENEWVEFIGQELSYEKTCDE